MRLILIFYSMKRLSAIHYTTILIILLGLLMNFVYYSSTGNFNSPMIEYEFVKDVKDVKNILMEDNEFKKDVIQGIHNQNLIDYAYMIAYTALLIMVFMKILKHDKKVIYNIGIIFSFLAIVGDAIENIQLFRISELLVARLDFSSHLEILILSTRIKWLSLAFALFILSFHYYKYKFIGKLFSLYSSLPLLFAVVSIFIYNENTETYFYYCIIIGFTTLILWTYISKLFRNAVSFYNI